MSPNPPEAPDVSVVVPTRGRRGYLAAAVASALAQTAARLELIVVDDDPAGTAAPATASDPRLRFVTSGGVGAAAARNRGLAAARAEAVAFLDDDDLWDARKLELQLALLAARPDVELVFCAHELLVEATGERLPASPPRDLAAVDLLRSTFFGCSIPLLRRRALLAVGGFDESLPGSQDRDLWLRLRRRAPFAWRPEALATVRLHGAQMSGELERKIAAKRRLLARHREAYRRHPDAHAHQLVRLGMMEAAAGRRWRALAAFVAAARRDAPAGEARRLLRECLFAPARQRRRLLAEGFARRGGVVHYW